MLYNYKEIINKYGNDYNLKKALKFRKIYKIEDGIYSDSKNANRMAVILKKYPGAIFTLESALYIYSLTKVEPDKYFLSTRRNYTRINNNDIKQIFNCDVELDKNALHFTLDDITLNVYSRERLLVEFLKRSSNYSKDYISEVMQEYKKIADFLDCDLVINYSKKYKVPKAKEFAIKYIHKYNYFDTYELENKNEVFNKHSDKGLYGRVNDTICQCCGNKVLYSFYWECICSKCGWWYDSDIETEEEFSYYNHKCLKEYKSNYYYLKKMDYNYSWDKDRNRVPIYYVSEIFSEKKDKCFCCGKQSINKWFEQCEFCGWIADYVQENKDLEDGPNILDIYEYKRKYNGIKRKIRKYKWCEYKNEWKEYLKSDKYYKSILLYDIKYL